MNQETAKLLVTLTRAVTRAILATGTTDDDRQFWCDSALEYLDKASTLADAFQSDAPLAVRQVVTPSRTYSIPEKLIDRLDSCTSKIDAIRLLRHEIGCGLREAKDVVEETTRWK